MQMQAESPLYIHVLFQGSLFTKPPLSQRQHLLSLSATETWDFCLWSAAADSLQCLWRAADTVQELWEMDPLGSWEGNPFLLLALRHHVQTGHEKFCKAYSFCREKMTALAYCAWLETKWSCPEVDSLSLVFHKRPVPSLTAHILTSLMTKTSEYSCEKLDGDYTNGELKPRQCSRLEIRFHPE